MIIQNTLSGHGDKSLIVTTTPVGRDSAYRPVLPVPKIRPWMRNSSSGPALFVPISLVYIIPLAVLLANLFVFGRLSEDNELLAMKSSGISLGLSNQTNLVSHRSLVHRGNPDKYTSNPLQPCPKPDD